MTRLPVFLLILLPIALTPLGRAEGTDPRVGDVTPVMPSEKVEKALNGTMGFPPSPAVPWVPDDKGFAKERLFHVPATGEHPRILFAEEDLPRIRKELASNEPGRAILATLRAQVAKGIGSPETWEGKCYAALKAGDLKEFKSAYNESPLDYTPPGTGLRSDVPGRNPATKWGTRNPLLVSLEAKAFLALIEDDPKAGREVATAIANFARYISPKVDEANTKPRHEFHWYSTRELVPNEIAYGYDWSWKWMTPEQRDILRSLIVRSTAGKYTLGMDLPAHWRNWNHLGLDESYAACLFAIEGEKGDDPRGRERIYEVFRDYITYGIDPLGSGAEGIGYQTAGFGHLAAPMIAFANRGKNLFTHPHYRKQTESWLVQAMQPYGGEWQSSSDLANFPPDLSMLGPQKYFYPEVAGVDFVFRNHPLIRSKDWSAIARDGRESQWITPVMAADHETRDEAQKEAAALVGGGLCFYDKERGSLYTRTGWGSNDLVLHVDCRTDTTFANHDHPDRGQFTLASHGRPWASVGYRDTESKFMNVVTIDGRGQGFFATPGDWVDFQETPTETKAVTDAKYCWDWMWMKSSFTESEDSLAKRQLGGFAEAARRLQSRIPLSKCEPDTSPKVRPYYEGFADRAHGDPRMWDDEDGWVLRTPWYPVRKAYRTVILARGNHPYVLVADDIRKDDAEHLYEWRMNMPPDVAAVSIRGGDILLGDGTTHRGKPELKNGFQGTTGLEPEKGNRLLLLRTLDVALPDLPTLQPIPSVSTIEYKKTDDSHQFTGRSMGMGTQVVIGSRSAEPGFLMLLYPHRHGEELPKTIWNEDKTRLTLSWKDQKDEYQVSMTPEGRRLFQKLPSGQTTPKT